uniref:DUF5641 domain-containing protein n=1 Tax=Megaselia scalaris TaxID=36166 RepID=T1GMU0_MEGSC
MSGGNDLVPGQPESKMVLIFNKGALAKQWELGRIVKAINGDDGFVRVVDVKTEGGIKRRAITQELIVSDMGLRREGINVLAAY